MFATTTEPVCGVLRRRDKARNWLVKEGGEVVSEPQSMTDEQQTRPTFFVPDLSEDVLQTVRIGVLDRPSFAVAWLSSGRTPWMSTTCGTPETRVTAVLLRHNIFSSTCQVQMTCSCAPPASALQNQIAGVAQAADYSFDVVGCQLRIVKKFSGSRRAVSC